MAATTPSAHNITTANEKDFSNHSSETATGAHSPSMAMNVTAEDHLKQIKRTDSIYMSPEMFEKLYLAPEKKVKGELRGTFANPTGLYACDAVLLHPEMASALTRSLGLSLDWSCHCSRSHATLWAGEELEAMAQLQRKSSCHSKASVILNYLRSGSYYWMGGLLMIMGSVGEWILGNTFPFLVFGAYGKLFKLLYTSR